MAALFTSVGLTARLMDNAADVDRLRGKVEGCRSWLRSGVQKQDVDIFHLANASVFESIDEANTFLDLPRDAKVLRRRQFLHRKALKFHAPRS